MFERQKILGILSVTFLLFNILFGTIASLELTLPESTETPTSRTPSSTKLILEKIRNILSGTTLSDANSNEMASRLFYSILENSIDDHYKSMENATMASSSDVAQSKFSLPGNGSILGISNKKIPVECKNLSTSQDNRHCSYKLQPSFHKQVLLNLQQYLLETSLFNRKPLSGAPNLPDILEQTKELQGGELNDISDAFNSSNSEILSLLTTSEFLYKLLQDDVMMVDDDKNLTQYINEQDKKIIAEVGEVGSIHHFKEPRKKFPFFRDKTEVEIETTSVGSIDKALVSSGYPTLTSLCEEISYGNCSYWASYTTMNSSDMYRICCAGVGRTTENEFSKADVFRIAEALGEEIYKLKRPAEGRDSFLRPFRLPPVSLPAKNPYLADSPWPMAHRHPYGQGSSALKGLDGSKPLDHDTFNRISIASTPISLLYTEDQKYLWGSSWTTIFKIDRLSSNMRLVDYIIKPVTELFEDTFHGAYSLLTKEGVFIVAQLQRLEAYYDDPLYGGDKIKKSEIIYSLQNDFPDVHKSEHFLALSMTSDGHLVWVTNRGKVGVIQRIINEGFRRSRATVQLRGIKNEIVEVSNGIACDEEGGIYVVSSDLMHKLKWDGSNIRIIWETAYTAQRNSSNLVRLGVGSGSTPSLMGDSSEKYVVITDDSTIMNVIIIDANTGEIKDSHPVYFGDPNATRTLSEQSILVYGWRLVIVNNTPPENIFGQRFVSALGNALKFLGDHTFFSFGGLGQMTNDAWPVLAGSAPKGVEQMQYNTVTGKLEVTWVNKDISIPNGIPTMSAASGLLYGIGKRGAFGFSAGPYRGMWTLEALDWWTGEPKFYYNLGIGPWSNSIYSATEVGPGEIITGTISGIVRIKESDTEGLLASLMNSILN